MSLKIKISDNFYFNITFWNARFSDVFSGYRNVTLACKRLKEKGKPKVFDSQKRQSKPQNSDDGKTR